MGANTVSLGGLVRDGRDRLVRAGIAVEEAALDAELLARQALGCDRAMLLARMGEEPPPGFATALAPLLERRLRREPMAYILGTQEFWGREFQVAPGVLIPRPETEILVEVGLAWARDTNRARPLRIVDVGTGSGCLAITLALELPGARVAATDISPAALSIAEENARRLGANVRFERGPLLAGLSGPFDLVVSNPPYVACADYPGLQPEVRLFEPEAALVAGAAGLDVIRPLLVEAATALRPGGRLLMEIGYGQADAVGRLVGATPGLELLGVTPDLQGIPRTVVAARGPSTVTSSG